MDYQTLTAAQYVGMTAHQYVTMFAGPLSSSDSVGAIWFACL